MCKVKENECVLFADWINNNWYVPAKEGMWKLDIENIEYRLEVPEINIFTSNELLNKFLNKEGEF